MKRNLILLVHIFFFISVKAQVLNSGNYHINYYTQDSAIYDMTAGTLVIGTNMTDTISDPRPIGFTFYYMGKAYDSLCFSSNGFIVLGPKPPYPTDNSLANNSTASSIIAPYWDHIKTGMDGGVYTLTTGSAPHRVKVILWEVCTPPNVSGTYTALIQAVLHENSNRIDFNYLARPNTGATYIVRPTTSLTGESTGIKAMMNGQSEYLACLLDNFLPYSSTYYSTNGSNRNDQSIDNNSAITFYADSAAAAPPTVFSSVSYPTRIDLSWRDNSVSEDIFRIYQSTDSVHYTEIKTLVSTTKSTTGQTYTYQDTFGIHPGTRYFYRIVASALGGRQSAYLSGVANAPVPLLSGVKRIPGDYNSITLALQDIHVKYLAGPIILELQQNYDSSLEVFPIVIDGSTYNPSPVNSITIRPAANVTTPIRVNSSAQTTLLYINGTEHIYINGAPGGTGNARMLSIIPTSGSGSSISENYASHDIYISNAIMKSITVGAFNASIRLCDITGSIVLENAINNILIDSNFFHDFSSAISSQSLLGSDIRITNNSFCHFYSGGTIININDYGSTGDYVIDGNYIGGSQPLAIGMDTTFAFNAISLTMASGRHADISHNVIRGAKVTTNATAIYAEDGDFTIENNLIGDTVGYSISCGGSDFTGILVYQGAYTQTVRGNIISGIKGTGEFFGIYSKVTQFSPFNGSSVSIIEDNVIGSRNQARSIMFTGVILNGIYAMNYGKTLIKGNAVNNLYTTTRFSNSVASYIENSGIYSQSENQQIIDNTVYRMAGIGIDIGGLDTTETPTIIANNIVNGFVNVGINLGGGWGIINANKVYSNAVIDTTEGQSCISISDYVYGTQRFKANILCSNNFAFGGYDTAGLVVKPQMGLSGIASNGKNVRILNNSIFVTSDSLSYASSNETYGLNVDSSIVANNIVVNPSLRYSHTSPDYGLSISAPQSPPSHDLIYCTGNNTVPCQPVGADIGAIYNTDPLFKHSYGVPDSVDLHLFPSSVAAGAAPAQNLVLTDIDGNLRPSGNITIGAHEINPVGSRENIPPVITYTPLRDTATTSLTLLAAISDSTLVMNESSASPPYIYYKKRSDQGWSLNRGSLYAGTYKNGQWSFPFASVFLQNLSIGDTVQYFLTAEDVWGNLATNSPGGSGYNTVFIDAYPTNPDFFVFSREGHLPHISYQPLQSAYINSNYVLSVNVTDSSVMNLSGDSNVICYYKRNTSGNYYKASGIFQTGTSTDNNWDITLNVSGMSGILPHDTVYYFVTAQDNNSLNEVVSLPAGVVGPSITNLSQYPSRPYFFTVVSSPSVYTPIVSYTPLGNNFLSSNFILNINVKDSQAMNLNGDSNVVCYFKRNNTGSYYKSQASYVGGTATNNNWSAQLNVSGIPGIGIGDTVYYYVAAQDNDLPNHLGSSPIGALGPNISHVAAPSMLNYFIVLDPLHIAMADGNNAAYILSYDLAQHPYLINSFPELNSAYRIINAIGQIVKEGRMDQNRINLGIGLSSGIYFLSILNTDLTSKQIIKYVVLNN